jgi:glutathione S-transferase
MKLYLHPNAPNCMKVVMTAAQLNISLESELVDLFQGAQRAPEYLAINPNGTVPTLRHGGFVLWESNAIMQYVAAMIPDNTLWPADERRRADISRWQCWELAQWSPAVSTYLRENMFKALKGQGDPDPQALGKGDEKYHPLASLLDGHLASREFLVADELTLADISVAAFLMYARRARVPLHDYQHIRRWLACMQALPSWKVAQPPGTLSD